MMDAYVARQPIFDGHKKIYGYELLFRDETASCQPGMDGDLATSVVLGNSFFAIGMDSLLGGKKSFINFTQNLLIQKVPLLLPKQDTVIEILESVEPTDEVVQACRELSRLGYTTALDDFTFHPKLLPLMELADIIKFDFRQTPPDEIQAHFEKFPRRPGQIMLAEKVETHEEFRFARDMGFDLFQGFFFCKPELVKGKEISGSQLNSLQILAEINKPDFSFADLESLIAPDVSLSYKLLRYINSAFFAKTYRIASIQQALVYLGEAEIRRFVSLITMSGMVKGKPDELLRAACIRGKFSEFLASAAPTGTSSSELFTMGIFSLIDAILDQPMGKVMDELPLSLKIKNALVNRKGSLVGYLALVECYEKAQWPLVSRLAAVLNIDASRLPPLYLQACQWANSITESK